MLAEETVKHLLSVRAERVEQLLQLEVVLRLAAADMGDGCPIICVRLRSSRPSLAVRFARSRPEQAEEDHSRDQPYHRHGPPDKRGARQDPAELSPPRQPDD